jgi:hypothetical protein
MKISLSISEITHAFLFIFYLLLLPCSNNIIKVILWGDRARQFPYNSIYDLEKQNPIIVLFVECLPKEFGGSILHL